MAIVTMPGREPEEESRFARYVLAAILLVVIGLFIYSLVSAYT